jgi:signal transduction histidine kinase
MPSVDSRDPLLHRLTDGALRICGADWSAIGTLARDAPIRWVASPRPIAAVLPREPDEVGGPAFWRALQMGGASGGCDFVFPLRSCDPSVAETRTSFAVPIRIDEQPEGLLCVGRRSGLPWTDRDRALLRWLADQAATLIAHGRLLHEAERRREEAEELAVLSQVMSQSLDSHEVAQRVVDSMRRLLGTLTCVLYGYVSAGEKTAEPLAASGVFCDYIPPHPPGIGAVGLARDSARVVMTSDILSDPRIVLTPAVRDYVRETDHGAVLAVPLRAGDRPIGVLAARGRTHRAWTADEVRLARILADQATIAIENARLFTESRRQRRTAETLALVARATARAFDIRALGQQIVDTVLVLMAGSQAALFAQDLGDNELRPVAVARRGDVAARVGVRALAAGLVEARAVSHERLVSTRDLLAEPGLGTATDATTVDPSTRSMLAAPLFHAGTVIGALSISDRAGRVFKPDEINVFLAAADHAAVALQSAHLHAQVTEAARVQERIRIANKLHDTLSQLAFSAGLKLDWCLHHVGVDSPLQPKLEDIRRETGVMMAQIRQLIGHLAEGTSTDAALPRRLKALADEFRELTATRIAFALEGDLARLSPAAQDALHKTLQEALVNIAKHARASRVTVLIEVDVAQAAITVSDDGIGFPEGLVGASGVTSLPGHHGLRQMRERLEALGGRLEVITNAGQGASIHGVVPLE